MTLSLNEVDALAKKATRGAGYPWGHAEEAGKAVRWLCQNGVDGCAILARTLAHFDGRDGASGTPDVTQTPWQSPGDTLCPIIAGTALSDMAPALRDGAIRMNAGCYGSYVADHLVRAAAVTRTGEIVSLSAADLGFAYRSSAVPEGWVITEAVFEGPAGDPAALNQRMTDQLAKRDATQPTKERTAGSTFRNPAGFSSTGRDDDVHDLKAWKVIDDAGMRGATLGGAQMSPKHSNFLVNTGDATAADLEGLGEEVRKKVFQTSGIELHWEIMRVGETIPT